MSDQPGELLSLVPPIGVLICDDVHSIRALLDLVVESRVGLHVVGQAANGDQAITAARQLQPDVVLLDLSMPVLSGLDALPEIKRVAPGVKVIVLSGFAEPAIRDEAIRNGADLYIEKGSHPDLIADAIEAVVRAAPQSAPPVL